MSVDDTESAFLAFSKKQSLGIGFYGKEIVNLNVQTYIRLNVIRKAFEQVLCVFPCSNAIFRQRDQWTMSLYFYLLHDRFLTMFV